MAEPITGSSKAPWHLWLVGVVGVLWNSVGALDFVMTQTQNEAYMSRLNAVQVESLYGLPAWLVGCWALAVWGGVLGALLLLLKRRATVPVLLISLLAMLVTAAHNFAADGGLYETGGTQPAFVLLIFAIALGLWLYARRMAVVGVLS